MRFTAAHRSLPAFRLSRRAFRLSRRAFSLIEVLLAMAILLGGITVILSVLPLGSRDTQTAIDRTIAAYIAQQKAEEIRRDDTKTRDMYNAILGLSTVTALTVYPPDTRFSYGFYGNSDPLKPSVLAAAGSTDPRDLAPGARVVVCYSTTIMQRADPYDPRYIVYELAF